MNMTVQNGVVIVGKTVKFADGTIAVCPSKRSACSSTIINDKVFINGYEYIKSKNKWKRTLKALWHLWF